MKKFRGQLKISFSYWEGFGGKIDSAGVSVQLPTNVIYLFALALCLSQTAKADSCLCNFYSPERMFFGADVLFFGKAEKVVIVKEATVSLVLKEPGTLKLLEKGKWKKGVEENINITFSVSEAFKGVNKKTIEIGTPKGGCEVPFKQGENYLVFANKRNSLLEDWEAKLPKETWTPEIYLKTEADKFNEKFASFKTTACLMMISDIDPIREFVKNVLPKQSKQ